MQQKMLKPLVFGATGVEGLPRSAVTSSFTAPSIATGIWILLRAATSVEGLARSAVTSSFTTPVGDITNRYTYDVVLNQQARVAHGGGMADCLLGGPIAGRPMAVQEDAGSYGGYPRKAHAGLCLVVYVIV
jgi:hypothetical protein